MIPILGFVLAVTTQAPSPVALRTIEGSRIEATSVELDPAAASVRLGGAAGAAEAALDHLVFIDFRGVPAPFSADVSVVLVDGSSFLARLSDPLEDTLAVEIPALGRTTIPLELVRVVALGETGERADPTRFDPTAGDGMDLVWRRGRSEGDRLEGTIVRIGKDGVASAGDLGEITLSPRDVLAATLANESIGPAVGPRRVEIDLREGGVLVAELVALRSERVVVNAAFGANLSLPFARVERIRFAGDRFAWLSDFTPTTVEQTPYLGADDEFLFPWRKDASVTGEPLSIGGVRYGKGLGLHSRTRLTFALDSAFSAFQAEVGVCDEVERLGLTGSAIARVFVDGERVFESGSLAAGTPAVSIPRLDLKGKKELKIEIDFGDGGDVGDRIAVVDPLLVRE